MAFSIVFWSYFVPFLVSTWWAAFWNRANAAEFYQKDYGTQRFSSVVVPDKRTILLLMFMCAVGGFLTLVIPDPDLVNKSPLESPWVLTHHLHAAMYGAQFAVLWIAYLGVTTLGTDMAKPMVMLTTALFYGVFMQMLLAPLLIPAPIKNGNGWDHISWLQDHAHVLFANIRTPLALTLVLEAVLPNQSWELTYGRCSLAIADAVYWFVLAVLFGTGWCDNYDGENADNCTPTAMGVHSYQVSIINGAIIICALIITAWLWFGRILPTAFITLLVGVKPPPRHRAGARPAGGGSFVGSDMERHTQLNDLGPGDDAEDGAGRPDAYTSSLDNHT